MEGGKLASTQVIRGGFTHDLRIRSTCFGQPDPTYRIQPTLDFFYENTIFVRWGLNNWGFDLKKQQQNNRPT